MNQIIGILTQYTNKNSRGGKIIKIPEQPLAKLNFTLSKGIEWSIGIDQSTSCTGLCFQTLDGTMQCVFDVKRDKAYDMRVYYTELFDFLKRAVTGATIKFVIMEKPVPSKMYTSQVLEDLRGHVEEWLIQIPELRTTRSEGLLPQTWKSFIVDKSKGKGRTKNKMDIAEDLVDRFPLLREYFVTYPYKDYDGFDATGILNGFMQYAFTPDGFEMIHGSKEKRHTSLVGYLWVDQTDVQAPIRELGEFGKNAFSPVPLVFNPKYNLHDNVRMCSSNYNCAYCIVPTRYWDKFMWKFNIDTTEKGKVMIMYVLKKGAFSPSLISYFKETIVWNEEVYDA